MLRAKYKLFKDCLENISSSKCSSVWRSLAKVWPLLRQSLLWSVDDGNLIKFWTDSWLAEVGFLINYCLDHSLIDESITLQEVVTMEGNWNWDYIQCFLNNSTLTYIAGILTPNSLVGRDVIILNWATNCNFTVKAAYGMLMKAP